MICQSRIPAVDAAAATQELIIGEAIEKMDTVVAELLSFSKP